MFNRIAIGAVVAFASVASARADVRSVPAGGDLQAALDAARPGDVVQLQSGATYTGNFRLPVKPAGAVITLRSSVTLDERRIGPDDRRLVAVIQSGNPVTPLACDGCANWRIDGIAVDPNVGGEGTMIELQRAANVTIDRVLAVGGPDGQKRAFLINGRTMAVTRSYCANIYKPGQDSQCVLAYDGPGPYAIRDNYLEAASENIMFGGADPSSSFNVPANIVVENNLMTKRDAWRAGGFVVKNLFELKCARNIIVRGNVMVGNWTDGQPGWSIVITPRNQDGTAPYCSVVGVTFERNIVRGERGVNVTGFDDIHPSAQATGITIRNNVFVVDADWFQATGEVGTLTIIGNCAYNPSSAMKFDYGDVWMVGTPKRPAKFAVRSLTMTGNLASEHTIYGSGTGTGEVALNAYTLAHTVTWQ